MTENYADQTNDQRDAAAEAHYRGEPILTDDAFDALDAEVALSLKRLGVLGFDAKQIARIRALNPGIDDFIDLIRHADFATGEELRHTSARTRNLRDRIKAAKVNAEGEQRKALLIIDGFGELMADAILAADPAWRRWADAAARFLDTAGRADGPAGRP